MEKEMNKNIETLYQTPYFDLIMINGYYMIEEKYKINGAVAVPIFPDGSILMIEHFRPAIEKSSIELPRGAKDKDETSKEAALRELQEETGLIGKDSVDLGIIHANSSFIRSGVAVVKVLLDHVEMPGNRLELEGEAQAAVRYSMSQVKKLIAAGEITCGHTLSALTMLLVEDSRFTFH